MVVALVVVFAKAPHRHALCFPSLPPFPLFAVARVNFEEEEEEEEEASDDDLIGTLDPVSKSAIFSSHLLMISLSLCSLFFSLSLFESAASLEKRTVLLVVVTLPLVEGEYYYSKRKRKRKRERKEERVEM